MKKRIVSIVLLAVLVLSLAFTVSAACDHTYIYICDYIANDTDLFFLKSIDDIVCRISMLGYPMVRALKF